MKFHLTIFIFLFIIVTPVYAQEYVYVNTDNLILRDRPEKHYKVFAILHAPCRVKVEPYDEGYKNNKAITGKFYRVSFFYRNEETRRSLLDAGWVEKKYTVHTPSEITVPGVDTSLELSVTAISLIPYGGDAEHDPDKLNYLQFPYPMYKGGEKKFETKNSVKHTYHTGSRGGCYYISKSGRKVYVDSKMCKFLNLAK